MSEHLLLKWGTLKGWDVTGNEKAMEALRRYHDAPVSMSAMAQHDTPEQKAALCDLIDAVDGPISSDWSGESFTKETAKKYVLDYGKPQPDATS